MKNYQRWLLGFGMMVVLVGAAVYFSKGLLIGNKKEGKIKTQEKKIPIYGQFSSGGRKVKILSTQKVEEVFSHLKKKGISPMPVSRIEVYLSETPSLTNRLEGRKDPKSGELLTAYGWDYKRGVLRIGLYVEPGYEENIDDDYWDAMVCASVWYALVKDKFWNEEDFGAYAFRDFYHHHLINYEKMVEIQ